MQCYYDFEICKKYCFLNFINRKGVKQFSFLYYKKSEYLNKGELMLYAKWEVLVNNQEQAKPNSDN